MTKGQKETFGVIHMLAILIGGDCFPVYTYVKTYQSVCFKYVLFTNANYASVKLSFFKLLEQHQAWKNTTKYRMVYQRSKAVHLHLEKPTRLFW